MAKKGKEERRGKAAVDVGSPRPRLLTSLPPWDDEGRLRVVVESPRGSTSKLAYDPETGAITYSRSLPLGLAYPYDWGFVPGTLADDGDPVDVLVVHQGTTAPGVVIPCRLLGAIRVRQKEKGEPWGENDRLVAAPGDDSGPKLELTKRVRAQIEAFFVAAVAFEDKKIRIEGWVGRDEAKRLVEKGRRRYA